MYYKGEIVYLQTVTRKAVKYVDIALAKTQ